MATQRNPFSLGLEQWAASMDPADIARGNSLAMGQRKTGLESEILADRIKHRGLFSQSAGAEGVNPTLIYGALTADSVDAAKALQANREGRVFDVTARGDGTPEQIARLNVAVGNQPTETGLRAIYGQAPEVKPENYTTNTVTIGGVLHQVGRGPDGNLTTVPIPGQAPAPDVKVIPPGGTAVQIGSNGQFTPLGSPPPIPLTAQQKAERESQMAVAAARAKTVADNQTLRPFGGDKNLFVLHRLGLVDMDGNAIEDRLPLNPIQLQSVMARAEAASLAGYSYAESVEKSLEEHGISRGGANLVPREFDGPQTGLFNPALDVETQTPRAGSDERLPLPAIGDGRYSATPSADFWNDTVTKDKVNNATGDLASMLRTDMSKSPKALPIPLRKLAKLTGIDDDLASSIGKPSFAIPYETGVVPIVDGAFYYKKVGNRAIFGVGGFDANGQPAIMFEE